MELDKILALLSQVEIKDFDGNAKSLRSFAAGLLSFPPDTEGFTPSEDPLDVAVVAIMCAFSQDLELLFEAYRDDAENEVSNEEFDDESDDPAWQRKTKVLNVVDYLGSETTLEYDEYPDLLLMQEELIKIVASGDLNTVSPERAQEIVREVGKLAAVLGFTLGFGKKKPE